MLVIGSTNSSNSNRLVEVAREHGAASHLIDNHTQVEEAWLEGVETVGITSGASAPEELVESLVTFFRERGADDVGELRTVHEDVRFMLPKEIRPAAARGRASPGAGRLRRRSPFALVAVALLERRVAVVQHQVVAVGVGEERHVADAGVEDVAGELDALGLELGAGRGDVIDVERQVGVLLRRELDPETATAPRSRSRSRRPRTRSARAGRGAGRASRRRRRGCARCRSRGLR